MVRKGGEREEQRDGKEGRGEEMSREGEWTGDKTEQRGSRGEKTQRKG